MAVRLGELLIKRNLLTQTQLEEALQAQVIFGGKLGTVLIEMRLISEETLAENLTKLISIPCAKPDQLQSIPQDIIKIISPELADKYKIVPVAVNGRNLTLAMADPRNLQSIDEISFRSGYIVRPILALEVRLVTALEKYYRIKRTTRRLTPLTPLKQVCEEPRHAHVFNTPAGPITALDTDEYLGMPGSEHVFLKTEAKKQTKVEDVTDFDVIEELNDDDLIEEIPREEMTLEKTAQALVKSNDRDDVADAIIAYLGTHYFRAALFMVIAGRVTGWRSAKNGRPIPGFDRFQLPLSEPSVLKTAVESNSYFLGQVPQSGANLALTSFLGSPAPATALLLPMSMLGRVVGLIYVDDTSADLSQRVPALQQLSSKALMTFEILILHNKILRL